MLPITDAEIAYAETILFGRTGIFDNERKNFIREFRTCDLQAVPGSGKTTVLLAKLLILETRLPFDDHRGILMISHTNAAIDEIKERIGKHCPKLFSSPNFVGTIQSFVDKFLALPYYIHLYKRKPSRIDDEIYVERAERFSSTVLSGFTWPEQNNAKYYLQYNRNVTSVRLTPGSPDDRLTTEYLGNDLSIGNPRGRQWSDPEKARVKAWVWAFKNKLMADGYLCFDDAYYLATKYINVFPNIIAILRRRFRHIFVDEMQDMEQHQYQLLESLFGQTGDYSYQRIGDKNQAIFNGAGHTPWMDRTLVLQITGSHRLSPINASIIQKLALSPIPVVGLKTNTDGSPIGIKPRMFVYQDRSIEQVIPAFANLIQQLKNAGQIPAECRHSFKAVCWNTKQEPQKVRIKNYYPNFNKENVRPMVNYPSLESYLYMLPAGRTMPAVYKNLSNALLRTLRLEGIQDADARYYTKTSLLDFLKTGHGTQYEALRLHLFTWCRQVLVGQEPAVLLGMKGYIPQLLQVFGKTINAANAFINASPFAPAPAVATAMPSNIYSANGINIAVDTVHSVKGQTHTATLYLESYYQREVQGSGNYESQRLAAYLLGAARPAVIHTYSQQSLKMAYVGFSRPTHLLCFAVHLDRFNERLTTLDPNEWEIVHI